MELLEGVDWQNWNAEPLAYPLRIAGDMGYRAAWIDDWLIELGVEPVIPSKSNQDPSDRPVEFDREAYRGGMSSNDSSAGSRRADAS